MLVVYKADTKEHFVSRGTIGWEKIQSNAVGNVEEAFGC